MINIYVSMAYEDRVAVPQAGLWPRRKSPIFRYLRISHLWRGGRNMLSSGELWGTDGYNIIYIQVFGPIAVIGSRRSTSIRARPVTRAIIAD